MSLVLNVEILGEFKNLTAATAGATTQLNGLNKTAKNISNKMNAAFAAIGIGFSLNAIISGLENAGKAAVADVKSMDLLALAMKNTGSATDDTVTAAEKYISKMQTTVGIADDDLRPAYQKLYLSTKDVTKANDLLAIALDTAAGTGKDLDVVAQAMAKSLEGNNTALGKLVPSVKDSKTPIEDMGKAFAGAAALAAQNDPFKTLTIIFGDMQEKIGMALLPTLAEFSTWLATPEGQEKLQDIIDLVIAMIGKFTDIVNFVTDNKELIIGFGGAFAAVALGVKAVNTATGIFNAGKTLTLGTTAALTLAFQTFGLSADGAAAAVSRVYAALGLVAGIIGTVGLILSIPGSSAVGAEKTPAPKVTPTVPPGTAPLVPRTGVPNAPSSSFNKIVGTTNNTTINVKSTQSAQEIASILQRAQKTNGVTSIRGGL